MLVFWARLRFKVLLVPVEAFIARTGYSLTWGTRLDRIAAELVKLAKSRSAASWFTSLNE
ncbi:hypothetical protein WAX88_01330 [Photobacterium damselae subsp. damselae]|uniref:hypothetical protein n=1 Tax=Photobacterium damselae TaxID=38293 RepID=UPI00311AD698